MLGRMIEQIGTWSGTKQSRKQYKLSRRTVVIEVEDAQCWSRTYEDTPRRMVENDSVIRRRHCGSGAMPERGRVESGAWVRTRRCADLLMVCQRIGGVESVVRRKHSGVWVIPERGRVESGAWDRSCRRADLVKLGQRIGGDGSFVRRKRSGGWEVTERMYGVVREESIDFRKIPYRLFRKTL